MNEIKNDFCLSFQLRKNLTHLFTISDFWNVKNLLTSQLEISDGFLGVAIVKIVWFCIFCLSVQKAVIRSLLK